MRRGPAGLLIALVATSLAETGAQPSPAQVVVFEGVNVVPMDRERVLANRTVVVTGDRITAIGAAGRVRVPAGARRIDGRGRYLLPGLADFHVHFAVADDMLLYLANGVTTVLDMGSFIPGTLRAWRDSVKAGQRLGPDIYVSFFADNPRSYAPMRTTEDARAGVATAKREGYDLIKVYNSLTAEQFAALTREARRQKLAVVGHGVRAVGLERGFAMGQVMVAHGEEYMYTTFDRKLDRSLFPAAVAFTRRSGAWVLPNLSAYDAITRQWGKPEQVDSFLASPAARFIDPLWRGRWRDADYVTRAGSLGDRILFLKDFTRALSDAGVPLLLGTDSPSIPGVPAGFSIHDELRLLVEAGLTPYQAIAAGTRAPGEFARRHLPGAAAFGTVRVGSRADLILVDGDPLADVARLATPAGVMKRGRWLPRAEMQLMLEQIAAKQVEQTPPAR